MPSVTWAAVGISIMTQHHLYQNSLQSACSVETMPWQCGSLGCLDLLFSSSKNVWAVQWWSLSQRPTHLPFFCSTLVGMWLCPHGWQVADSSLDPHQYSWQENRVSGIQPLSIASPVSAWVLTQFSSRLAFQLASQSTKPANLKKKCFLAKGPSTELWIWWCLGFPRRTCNRVWPRTSQQLQASSSVSLGGGETLLGVLRKGCMY